MAKLIAFTSIRGGTVLINPDHIVSVSVHPAGVTSIVLSSYINSDRQVEKVTHSIAEVEQMVNGANDD